MCTSNSISRTEAESHFGNEDEFGGRQKKNCLARCHLRQGTRVRVDALNDVSTRENSPKDLNWFIESCFVIAFIVSSWRELIFFNEIIALRVKTYLWKIDWIWGDNSVLWGRFKSLKRIIKLQPIARKDSNHYKTSEVLQILLRKLLLTPQETDIGFGSRRMQRNEFILI